MTSASEILAERLAKGEITPEQFDEMAKRIDSSHQSVDPQPPLASKAPPLGGTAKWLLISCVAALAFYGAAVLKADDDGGTLVANDVLIAGATVDFRLVNSSNRFGDVAIRVRNVESGVDYCRVISNVPANTTKEIQFTCGRDVLIGTFAVGVVWADADLSSSLPRID